MKTWILNHITDTVIVHKKTDGDGIEITLVIIMIHVELEYEFTIHTDHYQNDLSITAPMSR